MTGTTLGFLSILLIFVLVRYREHAKNAAVSIGQTVGSGIQGISVRNGLLCGLIGIATLLVLRWLYQRNLSCTDVAEWVWSNLLFTLVTTAITTAAVYRFFPKMWWIPAAILAGLLVIHCADSHPYRKVSCPSASTTETRVCFINTSLSNPFMPENFSLASGKKLCFTPKRPAVDFEQVDGPGGTFWQFKAKKGTALLRYRLMSTCPKDDLP